MQIALCHILDELHIGSIEQHPSVCYQAEGQADVPIAIMPRTGEITLLQSDGDLTEEEFQKAIDLAMEGCLKVSELQKEALMKKYSTE